VLTNAQETPVTNANPAIEQLAIAVEDIPVLVDRFLPGFDDTNRATQAPGLPNHAIWSLGHLALYHHRAAERIRGLEPGALPESDFVTGKGNSGSAERFDTESVCFASTPSPDASLYPSLERGRRIHADACARLAEAVRVLDGESCALPITWGAASVPTTALVLATRMIHHAGAHAGQILDLRRALALPRLIG